MSEEDWGFAIVILVTVVSIALFGAIMMIGLAVAKVIAGPIC